MKGSCLCGDIRFEVTGDPVEPSGCHCTQCRKQSGHFWAAADALHDDIVITGTPSWYEASSVARRGFCPRCGSFLFWQEIGASYISFALGAIEGPTGIGDFRHIFTAFKGDYYAIPDSEPQEALE